MGGFSARKAMTVVEHTEKVIAIEILAACQGQYGFASSAFVTAFCLLMF
jgi:histidine ammonia-lyase